MVKHYSDNFNSYVGKAKADLDKVKIQFRMVRNLCGHRDGFDQCRFTTFTPALYCKLENCPLLR